MSVCEFKAYLTQQGFDYIIDAPMDEYTTLKIGGKADILIEPHCVKELCDIISKARQENVSITFIGNGSNLLVLDGGIRGAVIRFGTNMSKTTVEGEVITAQSGILMSRLASVAAENSLKGFEFASGIPGTLGGGIVMNAGAYKGELKDVIIEVTALLPDGTIKVFDKEELDFSYRHSVFTDSDMLVLEAKIKLENGNKEEIKERIKEFSQKRRTTQPLEYPSAGSAFKRPQNGYAAAMIDASGLKGYTVGGAQVSEKHAGFIINKGNATAKDMVKLLKDVQTKVYECFNTMLEPEIIIIGEEN
ncbi:MAG: UDP-N-acetylmuramate dehydrogenase [Clostridiales bacterium]|nr:UDP-N-acetylmuramate dehydrogenase [Clostridiales bacterium]